MKRGESMSPLISNHKGLAATVKRPETNIKAQVSPKMSSTRELELKKRSSTISVSWAKDRETTSSFTKTSTLRLTHMVCQPHPSIISASIADSLLGATANKC